MDGQHLHRKALQRAAEVLRDAATTIEQDFADEFQRIAASLDDQAHHDDLESLLESCNQTPQY
jgi:hypothetical protein